MAMTVSGLEEVYRVAGGDDCRAPVIHWECSGVSSMVKAVGAVAACRRQKRPQKMSGHTTTGGEETGGAPSKVESTNLHTHRPGVYFEREGEVFEERDGGLHSASFT